MKKIILVTFIFTILFSLSFNLRADDEDKLLYLLKTSPGKDFKLKEVVFEGIQNKGEVNFEISNEFVPTLFIDPNREKTDFTEENGFSGLIIKDSPGYSELKMKDNNFLLISTTPEKGLKISKNNQETNLSLTSFSLKGENYELVIGPSNTFSWDSKGCTSSDFSSFISGNNNSKTFPALLSEDGGNFYMEFISRKQSFQFKEDENEQ